ncbi:MAG: YDG domain-containing protein, partial [Candidatus Omnitrophota bacterium]
LSGITASNKVYDATIGATVSTTGAVFGGKVSGDELTVASTGVFGDKNVASVKTVTLTNVLGGSDLGNYTITDQGTTIANITAKAVTLSGITASNKVYDAGIAATVSTTGAVFGGKVSGDELTVASTGVFSDKNVASDKTVTLTNTLGGSDFDNYTITDQGTTTANITGLTISGTVQGLGSGVSMILAVNGTDTYTATTTAGGAFSFAGVAAAGTDNLLVFTNDGSSKANLAGKVATTGLDISGISMASGKFLVGTSGGALGGAITNADLGTAKTGLSNSNIYYSVDGSNNATFESGIDLEIASGMIYEPGAGVTVNGSFNVAAGGRFLDTDPLAHSFSVAGNFSVPYGTNGFRRYTGAGSVADPFVVRDLYDLQAMKSNLTSNFELSDTLTDNTLDMASTASWNGGAGFDPIGTEGNAFSGSFDGNGNVISNLVMHREGDYSGLFGYIAANAEPEVINVQNLGLEAVSIYGAGFTGGLAGFNAGTLSNVYTTGFHTVSGASFVGGLVGANTGLITNAYSSAWVTAKGSDVGGLVGTNDGTLNQTYAMGYVTGGGATAGGLVGSGSGTITNSFYDAQMSGLAGNGRGSALTTAGMMNQDTYAAWGNFTNTWTLDNQRSYPHFQFRYPDGVRGVWGNLIIEIKIKDTEIVIGHEKLGPNEAVNLSVSSAFPVEDGGATPLTSGKTGASGMFYFVLGEKDVNYSDYVVVDAIGGETAMPAETGSIPGLDVTGFRYVELPHPPPINMNVIIPIDTFSKPVEKTSDAVAANAAVNAMLNVAIIADVAGSFSGPVTILDLTGTMNSGAQSDADLTNFIAAIPSTPATEPLMLPPSPSENASISFETPSPASEPVPGTGEESASSASTGVQSSAGDEISGAEADSEEMEISAAEAGISTGVDDAELFGKDGMMSEGSSGGESETPVENGGGRAREDQGEEGVSAASGEQETGSGEALESESSVSGESEGAVSGESEVAVEEASSNAKSASEDKIANGRDVPIVGFTDNENPMNFLTDVRVIEGTVYVLDSANAMSLLGVG